MTNEFEFGQYALQPLSGVGEAMYVAGVDGQLGDARGNHDARVDDAGEWQAF